MSDDNVAAATDKNGPEIPAPAGQTGPAGWFGAIVHRIFNKWTLGVLALLLALGWFAGMPSGELRLASFPDVMHDPEKIRLATELFQRADGSIDRAVDLHKQLSLAVDLKQIDIPIPPPAAPDAVNLKQFVPELSVDGSIDQDNTNIAVKVDALAIMERSYSWLGLTNYFVVIKSIEPAPCAKPPNTKCWQVIAQYWPSSMRQATLVGSEDELAENLAVLVLRGALRNEGDKWGKSTPADAPPTFIMAAETPSTMAALEATAKGMQILKLGLSHQDCQGKSEADCIEIARKLFQSSIDQEKTLSPVAAFGEALIEINSALQAARKLDSDLAVEAHLNQAEVWTTRALQSQFLYAAMAPGHAKLQSGFLDLEDLAPDAQLIDLSRRFACALADYRRANWGGCVSEVGQTADFPPPLQSYVEAAKRDAALSVAGAGQNFEAELSQLRQLIANAKAANDQNLLFMLRRVLLKQTCERPTALDAGTFEALLHETANSAPHRLARDELLIASASCRGGQQFPAQDDVDTIAAAVSAMPAGKERQRFVLLISQYLTRRGDMDGAFAFAMEALELPWTGAFIRNSEEFARLRDSAKGNRLITASFTPPTAYSDLETCQSLE